MFKKRKIFFFDIDGTLVLPRQDNINLDDKQQINFLQNTGNIVALCTGRSNNFSKEIKKLLNVDGPGIYYDGALVLLNEQTSKHPFHENHLEPNYFKDFMNKELPKRFIKEWWFPTLSTCYYLHTPQENIRHPFPIKEIVSKPISEWSVQKKPPFLAYGRTEKGTEEELFNQIKLWNNLYPQYHFLRWQIPGHDLIHFAMGDKKTNKFIAIDKVRKHYGFELEDVVFVGDGPNDVEAIQNIPNSFSPADSSREVRKLAKTILKAKCMENIVKEIIFHLKQQEL